VDEHGEEKVQDNTNEKKRNDSALRQKMYSAITVENIHRPHAAGPQEAAARHRLTHCKGST
jgi:hypothetical protein